MHSRRETDVGMTEYISPHKGFQGIIKMRFQDFIVNEIDENGDIVHLTDLTCDAIQAAAGDKIPETHNSNVLSEEDKEKLSHLISAEDTSNVMVKAGDSKEARTEIHKAIRWLYPELESTTVDDDNTKMIKVTKKTQGGRERSRSGMPRNTLCKFVMHKQNIGTMEAINVIAKRLNIRKANGFQYAGTKDKRAITTQVVTAPVAPERLCALNKPKNNISVGNFSYCKKPIRLGDLRGNHFSLVIRDASGPEDQIANAFRSFSSRGFINYFGLQRFGTTLVPTYSVGVAILKSDWKRVIDLVLWPRENDDKDIPLNRGLKEYAASGDAEAALKCLQFKGSIEGILLKGLSKYGKSQLLQAINMIPRNMRKMYVHSYQSYVWNQVVSQRINELGLEPVPGDLVFLETYENKINPTSQARHGEPPRKRFCFSVDGTDDGTSSQRVVALTEENVHLFSIHDILLPLPGHDIKYPENAVKKWYREIMVRDGIDIDTHMVHKSKDFSLPGAYRSIVVRPTRMEYDTVRYNDYTIPLLLTDSERMENKEPPIGIPDGKFLAMRVQFSLPSSSYATVALREILKIDISVSAQMELNKQHGPMDKPDENSLIDVRNA